MTDWSEVVARHGPLVWQTVRRLVGNEADAADCFQRAFLSALEIAGREEVRNWPGLLRRLATARALECLRQRVRQRSQLALLTEESAVDHRGAGPAQAAQANELAEDLRHALAQLDERQAQVFCLACLEELDYQEIAAQLGLTVNHVGVLLSRARGQLRERLEAHAPAADARREY